MQIFVSDIFLFFILPLYYLTTNDSQNKYSPSELHPEKYFITISFSIDLKNNEPDLLVLISLYEIQKELNNSPTSNSITQPTETQQNPTFELTKNIIFIMNKTYNQECINPYLDYLFRHLRPVLDYQNLCRITFKKMLEKSLYSLERHIFANLSYLVANYITTNFLTFQDTINSLKTTSLHALKVYKTDTLLKSIFGDHLKIIGICTKPNINSYVKHQDMPDLLITDFSVAKFLEERYNPIPASKELTYLQIFSQILQKHSLESDYQALSISKVEDLFSFGNEVTRVLRYRTSPDNLLEMERHRNRGYDNLNNNYINSYRVPFYIAYEIIKRFHERTQSTRIKKQGTSKDDFIKLSIIRESLIRTLKDYERNRDEIVYFVNPKVLRKLPIIFSNKNYGHFSMHIECKTLLNEIREENVIVENAEVFEKCEEFVDLKNMTSKYSQCLEEIENLLELIIELCPFLSRFNSRYL